MTAYNREKYIAEAIESILSSDYREFELLIVDDASNDNTVAIAKSYGLKDNRIKIFVNKYNLGDYPNRNKAASLASGKYIMFCDSDDFFYRDTIQYCIDEMEKNITAGLGMYYALPADEPFVVSSSAAIEKHFFEQPFLVMGPGGTIIKRDFFYSVGGYPEKYGPANDMYFNLKAAIKTDILLLPKLFLHYRIHDGQEKNNLYAYIHNNYRYMEDAINELNFPLTIRQLNFLRKKNNRRFVVNIIRHLKKGKNVTSAKELWNKAGFSLGKFMAGVFH
jgi:glycosyltransferase involved in cell wall biosynthesis